MSNKSIITENTPEDFINIVNEAVITILNPLIGSRDFLYQAIESGLHGVRKQDIGAYIDRNNSKDNALSNTFDNRLKEIIEGIGGQSKPIGSDDTSLQDPYPQDTEPAWSDEEADPNTLSETMRIKELMKKI